MASLPGPVSPPAALPLPSSDLLAELLARNEEMIAQFEVEQHGSADTPGFLSAMIGQHERAAALLRAKLARHAPHFDPAFATGPAVHSDPPPTAARLAARQPINAHHESHVAAHLRRHVAQSQQS